MTSTFEWAAYPRLLEHNFFEWTKKLYDLEKVLQTPIQDSMHWTRRFEYPWVLSKLYRDTALPHANRSYLDVGAGATALQFCLAQQKGWLVTSIDPDESAVQWVNRHNRPGNISVLGGLPKLPFADQLFDTMICVSVLEHLSKDQVLPSIRELLRVSRKEVLITMDVALGNRHPVQVDQSDLDQYMQTLQIEIPEPNNRITFQINGCLFGVACIHIIKG